MWHRLGLIHAHFHFRVPRAQLLLRSLALLLRQLRRSADGG
jgi:hypothetical protein